MNNYVLKDTILAKQMADANDLFADRNAEYGNAFEKYGSVVKSFFPEGVTLKTGNDFKRFGLVCSILNKMSRYCKNFDKGHPDSIADASVYCHMLSYVDEKEKYDGK